MKKKYDSYLGGADLYASKRPMTPHTGNRGKGKEPSEKEYAKIEKAIEAGFEAAKAWPHSSPEPEGWEWEFRKKLTKEIRNDYSEDVWPTPPEKYRAKNSVAAELLRRMAPSISYIAVIVVRDLLAQRDAELVREIANMKQDLTDHECTIASYGYRCPHMERNKALNEVIALIRRRTK